MDNIDASFNRAALIKSDKAIDEFLNRNKICRDMDVVELYLGFEGLTDMRSLYRYHNLKRLWLQANKFKRLPFLLNCHSISEIYLQNNLLKSVDQLFRHLKNLKLLFLHENELSDLNEVANELSYLKNLQNLNLFNNPMALENNYRKLLINRNKDLQVLDRNTITPNERKSANEFYEPERKLINSKHAFLRCISLDTQSNQSPFGPPIAINSNRSSLYDTNQNLNQSSTFSSFRQQFPPLKAIKEFSYFDWSKVKLLTKSSDADLTRATDNNIDNNFNSNIQNKIKDLPQVITIRFI